MHRTQCTGPALPFQEAVDILLVMLSPRAYLGLVEDHGWTPGQAIDWLAATIPRMIFVCPE